LWHAAWKAELAQGEKLSADGSFAEANVLVTPIDEPSRKEQRKPPLDFLHGLRPSANKRKTAT
jgi:hypothetical protein